MQIRIANKQDESAIRTLFQTHLNEFNRELDLSADGAESDLRNIEGNYFGRDGIFLVASVEKDIVAIAGGRRKANESGAGDEVFHIKRLFVEPKFRRQHVASQMVSIISKHAGILGFKRIEVKLPEHLIDEAEPFLKMIGFKLETGNTYSMTPSIKACGTQTCT